MIIKQIFNNNIVSTLDDKNQELLILGRGIGFQFRAGDTIDEGRIEKIFRLQDASIYERFKAIVTEVPIEILQVTDDIVSLARMQLNKQISDGIYVSLSDHINFAVQRMARDQIVRNPLSWEVQHFYKAEYDVAKEALTILRERLGIDFPKDEICNIALHFINAEVNDSMNDVTHLMQLLQEIMNIIKYHFSVDLDEDSVNYFRFITHLKYFCQRVITHSSHDDTEEYLYEVVRKNYPETFKCIIKIETFILKNYDYVMTHSEQLYLTLHLERLMKSK
ncbi:transcription antiterminator LicT [Paenibacillus sp. FSL R7-0273]|uniref:BglG family transcription antiterminator LicT n=1 Tax=Paenibacillus sp. FSL R7-0273 TaxID=1536772 RepID=UPI0004F5A95A|nr:PRD domain-containing protein [Paenibacillus sp. FSL R7-0273]AIQ45979.1 transcription antiterminator LicT [Paenibacillus sp. FSL R7-0273]OMF92891.1 transcription antiterminator LicT [Paenibacillus sp. FSL R7-0273]